jgi:hypothetical protein
MSHEISANAPSIGCCGSEACARGVGRLPAGGGCVTSRDCCCCCCWCGWCERATDVRLGLGGGHRTTGRGWARPPGPPSVSSEEEAAALVKSITRCADCPAQAAGTGRRASGASRVENGARSGPSAVVGLRPKERPHGCAVGDPTEKECAEETNIGLTSVIAVREPATPVIDTDANEVEGTGRGGGRRAGGKKSRSVRARGRDVASGAVGGFGAFSLPMIVGLICVRLHCSCRPFDLPVSGRRRAG